MKYTENKNADRWSFDKTYVGRKNNNVIEVHWSNYYKHWWYSISPKDGKSYNSLWDDIKFETREECEVAAENFVSNNN